MKTFLQRTISCLIIFVCLLACVSVKQVVNAASTKYTFASYAAGTQYADAEKHVLDDKITITTTDCHFTSELRIYSSSTYNGFAVIQNTSLTEKVTGFTFNCGNKVDVLNVLVSNDGVNWSDGETISVTSTSYNDYSISFTEDYSFFKLDVEGTQQIRIKYMTVVFEERSLGNLSNAEFFQNLSTQASAKFAYDVTKKVTEGETVTSYEKATSIAAGDQVVIVCETKNKEFTGFSTTSTVYGLASDYNNSLNATFVFDVVDGSSSGTYAFKNGSKYLNWSSGNSATQATSISTNSSWNVSFSNGDAVITNAKDATRKLQYNAGSPRFACYTSVQTAIQLYKKVVKTGQTVEENTYTISSAGLRFGATIQKDLYEALLSEGAQFGVAFAKKSELNGTDEFNKDSAVKYNLCSNIVLLDDGENYQFALVINNIPAKAFDEVIIASVYVEIAGVKYVANTQNEYSILTILDYYYNNADTLELDSALMEGLLNSATEQNAIAG